MDGGKKKNSHPSCNCGWHLPWPPPPECFRDDGVKYCGADETSISMDMTEVGSNKKGCWVYEASGQIPWNINNLKTIEWDAEWENCDNMWLCPLWMTPGVWKSPQWSSGEIDFMESCRLHSPRNNFGTSIICSQHPTDCYDKVWGPQDSSNGVQHFSGKIDSEGTWTLHRTTTTNGSPELISRYPYYTTKITYHKDFSLMSDIFNGGHGDSGWSACGQLNYGTQCRFVIANITINT